jgi:hypothetical protein
MEFSEATGIRLSLRITFRTRFPKITSEHIGDMATRKTSTACRIENIAFHDATILPGHANPGRMELSERTCESSPNDIFGKDIRYRAKSTNSKIVLDSSTNAGKLMRNKPELTSLIGRET